MGELSRQREQHVQRASALHCAEEPNQVLRGWEGKWPSSDEMTLLITADADPLLSEEFNAALPQTTETHFTELQWTKITAFREGNWKCFQTPQASCYDPGSCK